MIYPDLVQNYIQKHIVHLYYPAVCCNTNDAKLVKEAIARHCQLSTLTNLKQQCNL